MTKQRVLTFGYEGDSIYVIIDMNWKKLGSWNVIFMENQTMRNDSTESPIEFPSQIMETSDNNDIHTDAKTKHQDNGLDQMCEGQILQVNLSISVTKSQKPMKTLEKCNGL